jgi:hypothetical protein
VADEPKGFDYLTFLQTTHDEAKGARVEREVRWRNAWDLYNGVVDFSKKAKWQSQQVVSEFAQTVDTGGDLVQRSLIEAREFYTIEGEGELDKLKAPLIKRLEDLWLRLANFQVTFSDGIRVAGIVDFVPFKITWPEWYEDDVSFDVDPNDIFAALTEARPEPRFVQTRRSGLKVELMDPFRVWVDASGRNRYVIESTTTDLDELRRMSDMAPDAWDKEAISRLEAGALAKDVEDEVAKRAGLTPTSAAAWRRPVTLLTFWGDVVDKDGTYVGRDRTFAVATSQGIGGQFLVGKPRPIPYWHKILDRRYPNKRGPIVWGSLFRIPLAAYGKGFSYDSLGLAQLIVDQVNNLVDQDSFAGINAFEVDVDAMSDPEELKDGIYPGIALKKRGDIAGDRQILTPRVLGQVNPGSLQLLQTNRQLYQNSTGVTSYVSPSESTKTTPTLGEYRGRQAQAMGKMDMIARGLEDSLLVPILETVYWTFLQYMDDFSLAPVIEALGPDAAALAGMSDAARFSLLKASVRFKVRGLSAVLAKAEEVQKLGVFGQFLEPILKAVPALVGAINWRGLMRKGVEALNWDPDEVLLAPQQAATEQEALAGAQGMQPGMAAAPGGAPGIDLARIAAMMAQQGNGQGMAPAGIMGG